MIKDVNVAPSITQEEMTARYLCAESLMGGKFSKTIARNTTLVPCWIGESDCFFYVREFSIGKEYRLVDAREKKNTVAFCHKTVADALSLISKQNVNPEDLPISHLDITLSSDREVAALEFSAFSQRWIFDVEDNQCKNIEVNPDNWLVSPDGKKAVFTRDHNIWLRDIDRAEEYPLTEDGEEFYCYASGPSAWGVKYSKPQLEALWSPDSKRLFTLQIDTRKVKKLPLVEYVPSDGSSRPRLITPDRRLALPGDDHIDEYRFLAIEVATGKQQDVHYRRCSIFKNVMGYFNVSHQGWWSTDNRHAYFIDIERRGDAIARLVEFDTFTGATRVVIEEESPDVCFRLRLDSRDPIHTRPLPDSGEVIWFSERSNWGHLYLYDQQSGKLKHAITEGEWVVREVHHYDVKKRELIIQTAGRVEGRDPYYRDICRVNIDTGVLTPLVSSDHEYIVFDAASELGRNLGTVCDVVGGFGVSPTGSYLAATQSRVDLAPVSLLFDRDGNEIMTVETADVSDLPDGWQWPERVSLLAADGKTEVCGNMYFPTHFDPAKSYPVLDCTMVTYKEGWPSAAGSFTNSPIAGMTYFTQAALAQLGFIVVDIVGRGTNNRGREFFSSPDTELPGSDCQIDRMVGIQQLAKRYSYMDLDRVGAGGAPSNSCGVSSLLGSPDFYKAAVSYSPLLDLRLAPAWFGEGYGRAHLNEDGRLQVNDYAERLKGKLLLMHAMVSPTVSVAQTLSLVDALQEANKDFDLMLLPKLGYGESAYATRYGWDYLVRHVMGEEPPVGFKLTQNDPMVEVYAKRLKQT